MTVPSHTDLVVFTTEVRTYIVLCAAPAFAATVPLFATLAFTHHAAGRTEESVRVIRSGISVFITVFVGICGCVAVFTVTFCGPSTGCM